MKQIIYDFPELYDEQYNHYHDDLGFYTRLAEDYGSPVLELGAGTGRVSRSLARAGHQVVGIELSTAMLEQAKDYLEAENLHHLVSLQQGDMRELSLGQSFPVIIAPFNVLMHLYTLQDQDKAFSAIKRHLTAGGIFAFDLFHPKFEHLDVLRREAQWTRVGGPSSELFLCQTHDPEAQVIESRYYLDTVLEDGLLSRQVTFLKQRYYTRFELERALRQTGFKHVQFYGGFDKRRYETEAMHIVGLARIGS